MGMDLSSLNIAKTTQAFTAKFTEELKESEALGKMIGISQDEKAEDALLGANITTRHLTQKEIERSGGAAKHLPKNKAAAEQRIFPPEKVKEEANAFQQDNKEEFKAYPNAKTILTALAEGLKNCQTSADVVQLVKNAFPKAPAGLQAKVFDFLEKVSVAPDLKERVLQAKADFLSGSSATAQTKSIGDIAAAEQPDAKPSTLESLNDPQGEAMTSFEATKNMLKNHDSLTEAKKNIHQNQSQLGSKYRQPGAESPELVNLGKQGHSLQDALAFFNEAEKIEGRIVKWCQLKEIDPPSNVTAKKIVETELALVNDPRPTSDHVLVAIRRLTGG